MQIECRAGLNRSKWPDRGIAIRMVRCRETERVLRRLYGCWRPLRVRSRAYHRAHVWQPTKLDCFPGPLLSLLVVRLAACCVGDRAEAGICDLGLGARGSASSVLLRLWPA